ncbi:hypothetical protein SLEP1_g2698 [Rubroshorea leprosula]|uniref:Uncharacterized protein n=1 Tax=Rubroshorea leprosula TaxID=152421 RepID=A0AAV5HNZ3_9ROSI|nr:hypothetical protein SLEP1_g2698 [Rubroshorea leprosula]
MERTLPSSFAAILCSLSFSLAASWQLEHHNSNTPLWC